MSKSRFASVVIIFALGLILGLAINTPVASLSGRASTIAETPSAAIQGSQKAWEYRLINNMQYWYVEQTEKQLNSLGQQGFEICEITPIRIDNGLENGRTQLLVWLRRPKS